MITYSTRICRFESYLRMLTTSGECPMPFEPAAQVFHSFNHNSSAAATGLFLATVGLFLTYHGLDETGDVLEAATDAAYQWIRDTWEEHGIHVWLPEPSQVLALL